MVVGILRFSLAIHDARSLKDKRRVVLSIKEKVKNRFNVSIAEVDDHDFHKSASLGVCVVASEQSHADSQLQKTLNFISSQAPVIDVAMEFISL